MLILQAEGSRLRCLRPSENAPNRVPCTIDSSKWQWDLGEFDQKGSIATRWGSKTDFLHAIAKAKSHGIDSLIDAILNVSFATVVVKEDAHN